MTGRQKNDFRFKTSSRSRLLLSFVFAVSSLLGIHSLDSARPRSHRKILSLDSQFDWSIYCKILSTETETKEHPGTMTSVRAVSSAEPSKPHFSPPFQSFDNFI